MSISRIAQAIFELPDCFWNGTSVAETFDLSGVIIRGNINGTGDQSGLGAADPILRFPFGLVSLAIRSSILVNPSTAPTYAAHWQTFSSTYPALAILNIENSFAGGSLFTNIPASLQSTRLVNVGLTGTISASLFASSAVSSESFGFFLQGNALSGSLPAALLTNFNSTTYEALSAVSIDFGDNQLTGTLPSGFMRPRSSLSSSLTISVGGNKLTGSLPSGFLSASWPYQSQVSFNVSHNSLSGSLPVDFASGFLTTQPINFYFHASNNLLSGSVPSFFANLPSPVGPFDVVWLNFSQNRFSSIGANLIPNETILVRTELVADVSSNLLTGSLPPHLTYSNSPSLSIHLDDNKISGSIPANWLLSATQQEEGSFTFLTVSLSNNALTGTIPDNLFAPVNAGGLYFDVHGNTALQGTLPSSLVGAVSKILQGDLITLDFSNCGFTGALPNIVLPPSVPLDHVTINVASNKLNNGTGGVSLSNLFNAGVDDYIIYNLVFNISYNLFVGPLDLKNLPKTAGDNLNNGEGLTLDASGNAFTSVTIDDSWAKAVYSLDISKSSQMTRAVLDSGLFDGETALLAFLYASDTAIVGSFPNLGANGGASKLVALDLSDSPSIDFCGGNRTAWSSDSLSTCLLIHTNATKCAQLYPSKCLYEPTPAHAPPGPTPSPHGSAKALAVGASVIATIMAALVLILL